MLNKELLDGTLKVLELEISDKVFEELDIYAQMLVEENNKINLTAITDTDEMTVKHFADSLSILATTDIEQGSSLVDVGTGAGFPGLVLKIARPDLQVTFLDSTEKKLLFISSVLEKLGLKGNVLHMRAEEAGHNKAYREKFDYVTARAVAPLAVLSEYCLPLLKVGGSFISMKSANAEEEIRDAELGIEILGGSIDDICEFRLADKYKRNNILISKIESTPNKYPRNAAQIKKKHI